MKKGTILIIFLLTRFAMWGQSTPPIAVKDYETIKITEKAPVIDGDLTEDVWMRAAKSGSFIQHEPYEGREPSFQTEFAVIYDNNSIYVGIWAQDPDPDSISRRLTRRDEVDGDLVGIDFDSYHDHRTAFGFWVSASGVKMDRIMTGDGNTEDQSWDPNWDVKTKIVENGWTAEMKIPFSQLRFEHTSEDGWGLNLMRYIFRKDEVSIWQRIPKGSGGFTSYYGNMTGLQGITPKKQFDITPYVVGEAERFEAIEGNPFRTGKDYNYTAGLDAKIGITSNITLDLSVNPDFGQVEADPSEVNLTAYETFFEEKRPFFIEGRSILSMPLMIGDGDLANENLFYTRRVGRRPQGYPALNDGEFADIPLFTKILAAAKMTGKTENGWSVGLLETLTADEKADISLGEDRRSETVEPLSNYLVASVGKDFNEGNTIIKGLITSVNRKLDGTEMNYLHSSAYSGGFDFTQLFKNKTYLLSFKTYFSQVNGSEEAIERTQRSSTHYFQRPDAPHLQLDPTRTSLSGNGGSMMFGKVGNSPLNFGAFLNWKTPGVNLNDAGFIQNTDNILPILWASYSFFEPFSIFRSLRFNSSFWTGFDFSGEFQGVGGNINSNMQFTNFWRLNAGFNLSGADVSTGMLRGGPRFKTPMRQTTFIGLNSDTRKKFSFGFTGFAPVTFEGHSSAKGANIELSYRPMNNLTISLLPNIMMSKSNLQYIEENTFNGEARYIFGSIDQKVLGMSLRFNLNITPDFTIQYWGQPFVASGEYDRIKMITDPMADQYTDRFHEFTEDQISCYKDNGYCAIDENIDGNVDYYVSYPDFNFKEFKSNLVARWEYKSGSVLYLVWSQGRSGSYNYGNLDLNRDFNELFQVYPHNVFLIKFSYRFGL
jgi:hypothetical protein